ncbi:MAG: hypothetical protein AB7U92_00970 [Piscinibacter sp.]|uniref:hypothetical protein n=1 Tax=Piscinibacter sp. TaxID=1903157 RepID=UPI003D0F1093
MQYIETVARSAELLRQAVPLMSQQAAALHPVSYEVWYEYVARINLPLQKAVDDSLTRLGRLDEAKTYAIYRQHISEVDPRTAERVADGFERVLSGMSDSANRASLQTERYSDALVACDTASHPDQPKPAHSQNGRAADVQAAIPSFGAPARRHVLAGDSSDRFVCRHGPSLSTRNWFNG